jgi:D-glycero-beta-D-manno-heptose-7-phosphate kinase
MTDDERTTLLQIVDRFEGLPLAVVGDMVADLYIYGVPQRVSREAPVLVLTFEGEEFIPGGAANTANNLVALGAEVHPVGLLGDDEAGRAVTRFFTDRGVDVSGLVTAEGYRTITKTRVLAGAPTRLKHQLVRIDREPTGPVPAQAHTALLAAIREIAPRMRGFIFSDYGYGVAAPGVAAMLEGVRVADSRAHICDYAGFTAITPNDEEAAAAVGHPVTTEGQVRKAGKTLLDDSGVENVVITRGNKGMALFSKGGDELFLPASGTEEVTDVTGAGDTVTGVLSLALTAGASPADATRLANHAAGVVVTRVGAATLTREELKAQIEEGA